MRRVVETEVSNRCPDHQAVQQQEHRPPVWDLDKLWLANRAFIRIPTGQGWLERVRCNYAALLLLTTGVAATAVLDSKTAAYKAPPTVPPMIGASQNNQSCPSAHPPTRMAGPVLRAGFTERFVTGIPIRWISVNPSPIAIGAKPDGARRSVAPIMIITKKKVSTTSATKHERRE